MCDKPILYVICIYAFLSAIQGDNHSCFSESPCRQPGYVPKRKPLTMPTAIRAYDDALRKNLIYKAADSFHLVWNMDNTYHVHVYIFVPPVLRHLLGGIV